MMPAVRLNARNYPSFASVLQPAPEDAARAQAKAERRRRRRAACVRPPPRPRDPLMTTVDRRGLSGACPFRPAPETIAILTPKPSVCALALAHADSVTCARRRVDCVSGLFVDWMGMLGLRRKKPALVHPAAVPLATV